MKVTRRLPSFEGVAAGAQATLRCPIGLSYHQILITYSGVTLAQMNEIRVVGNGKTFMRFTSGSRLDSIAQYHNRAAASGIIVIDFTRPNMRTREAELVTLLGTGAQSQDGSVELSTLAIEIDIDGAASAPALSAKAIQSEPANLGFIKHIREYTYNPAASGEFEISDIPKGHLFSTMHFVSSDVNSLRVERDGYTVFERTAAENTLIQTDSLYRDPQSGIFTFDPTELGLGGEALSTGDVFDLRFIVDMASSGALPVVVESIAPLN
jgi:hypothetical protein